MKGGADMGEFIERQGDAAIRNMRFGALSNVGKSGCGAVAAYNIAEALGHNPSFAKIVREISGGSTQLSGGLLGASVFRLRRWLQKRFGRAELHLLGSGGWEEKTRLCRAVVILYKNRGLFTGSHFIAGNRAGEGFVFHNAPGFASGESVHLAAAVARLKKKGHMPLFLIVL